ncbi:DegV family protein [Adlercreutzia sp. ZJ242]|uniref:DegV family protein n=1 Tax=Adlercreutzia sp. ZJ242 TaxID=2709409 RepID=UPI0013EDB12D|nr:DegV family protein [Adlercreutzia sp. ZJ242]
MPKCNLIIDSCCDLPPQVVDREGVYLLKFPYILDGQTFEDDLFQSVSAPEFYDAMRKGAEPSTSQISMPVIIDAFNAAVDSGIPTVYLAFTSGMSGSYDVAMLVYEQVRAAHPDFELYVVDTRLASVAEGLFVYEAVNQREKGLSAAELASWAEEARCFINEEFMVEDLEALRRGGRIPGSVAVAGSALDVKPLLNIDADGKLALVGVARGRKKGIKQLAEYFQKNAADNGPSRYVAIGHADCPKDAQRLRDALLKVDENIMFLECNIGPVIGSHVGPGMLAVVFWGRDKRENLSVADRIARRVKGGN